MNKVGEPIQLEADFDSGLSLLLRYNKGYTGVFIRVGQGVQPFSVTKSCSMA